MYIVVPYSSCGGTAGKFKVRFFPSGLCADVDDGVLVSDAARAAGVVIGLPCGGGGRCRRCVVNISEGKGTPERVLACLTSINGNVDITVPQYDGSIIASGAHRVTELNDIDPLVPPEGANIFGLAVDIGTTTVAVSVVDMRDGREVYTAAGRNGQGIHGDDVLSRIEHAHAGGTDELRGLIVNTVNDLIAPFGGSAGIGAAYIAGNTVMTHLFLGTDPSPIRVPPYEPVVKEAEVTGAESGLSIAAGARVVCMPSPAAYVGGDITAGIVSSGMDESDELSLLIDVGTNGEVALGNKELMMVCSSSAGPAFEGGKMTSGMMAKPGAIDSFRVTDDDKFEYTVIGGTDPKGLCGSGLIDVLAQLFRVGFIDKKGRYTNRTYLLADVGGEIVTEIADGVYLSNDDAYNAIMTKAAIYSATETLVKGLGVSISDISKIYIAGGFGNFINMESAIAIGMFPDVPRDRFVYLGNASLAGAKYALLSSSVRRRVKNVFERMTYVDLSSDPTFSDEYMSALFIPHTDSSRFPTYADKR